MLLTLIRFNSLILIILESGRDFKYFLLNIDTSEALKQKSFFRGLVAL